MLLWFLIGSLSLNVCLAIVVSARELRPVSPLKIHSSHHTPGGRYATHDTFDLKPEMVTNARHVKQSQQPPPQRYFQWPVGQNAYPSSTTTTTKTEPQPRSSPQQNRAGRKETELSRIQQTNEKRSATTLQPTRKSNDRDVSAGKLAERKHHAKGGRALGYHNVFQKDEFKKDQIYFGAAA